MKKQYTHVGDAGSDHAILTSAAGYDVAVLHPVTRDAPGLPPEHHLSPEEWQRIINLVDAAPAMLAALQTLAPRARDAKRLSKADMLLIWDAIEKATA